MLNFLEWHEIDDEGGVPANEGTVLHSFCESAIVDNLDAYSFIGETRSHEGYDFTMDDKTADLMQDGLDFIDTIPGKLVAETRVDLSRWLGDDQGGTLDIGIVNSREIVIFDWKWGYLPVSPIENYQLMLYALGFYYQIAQYHTDATRFRLVIWQPRAPNGGGEWVIELEDLLDFGKFAKRRAAKTRDPRAKRTPGTIQCAYCPGAKTLTCKEYADYNLKGIVEDFEEMDENIELGMPPRPRNPRGITPERRSWLIEHRAMFMKFFDRIEADELDDFLKGLPTPGRKAVDGRRPKREWVDEDKAKARLESLLDEDAYTKKLLSPTQAEKALSGAIYGVLVDDGMIQRGDPQPIMVPADDERESVRTILDMFDDE